MWVAVHFAAGTELRREGSDLMHPLVAVRSNVACLAAVAYAADVAGRRAGVSDILVKEAGPADKAVMLAAVGLRMESGVVVGSAVVVEPEWDIAAADTEAETWTIPAVLRNLAAP